METLTKKNNLSVEEGMLLPLMEEFFSIQGEGFNTGKAAYFIRIGGCDVGCHWCDVKESWDAGIHPLTETKKIVENVFNSSAKAVVITGGEPCMYNLSYLTKELKKKRIQTFLETSGAYEITGEWDWICLSPKKNRKVLNENFSKVNELKIIVYNRDDFHFAEEQTSNSKLQIPNLFLQPEWSRREKILPLIVEYVQQNPQWRISLQTHKYIGIP
ncbi:MAG: 7-carboxy-7-deazaguanine synthase QueE [Bacteroidetes bacterium]|nr:7-carboxy-7-deazaguanine synthase QueE [Bacteroidota bacterium]